MDKHSSLLRKSANYGQKSSITLAPESVPCMRNCHYFSNNNECRYAECRWAECRGAKLAATLELHLLLMRSGRGLFGKGQRSLGCISL
jgi:hypothetical protein